MQDHTEIILKHGKKNKNSNFVSRAQFEDKTLSHDENFSSYLYFVLVESHPKPATHCMMIPGLGEWTSFRSRRDNPWRQRTVSRKHSTIEAYKFPVWKELRFFFFFFLIL